MQGYTLGDTIVALSTPYGRSAIAVVRLSGPDSARICMALAQLTEAPQHKQAQLCELLLKTTDGADVCEQAVLTFWQSPHSYSGEDIAEISVHGNPLLARLLIDNCRRHGARLAEAGEFTYRTFISGKLDLAQAEAVQQLISAGSTRALRLAESSLHGAASRQAEGWAERLTKLLAGIEVIHDYASDDLDANLDPETLLTAEKLTARLEALRDELREGVSTAQRAAPLLEGITVAIVGPPNVGKSTLFNALLGYERSLTAAQPGTTRDYVSESVEAAGVTLTLVDTAGYREAADNIEAAGVARTGEWARSADSVILVTGADDPAPPAMTLPDGMEPLRVVTRCDLLPQWPESSDGSLHVSGTTGQGIDALWQRLNEIPQQIDVGSGAVFNARQSQNVSDALSCIEDALAALADRMPMDAAAADLYRAAAALHGVYRSVNRAAVVNAVFAGFCVGK